MYGPVLERGGVVCGGHIIVWKLVILLDDSQQHVINADNAMFDPYTAG